MGAAAPRRPGAAGPLLAALVLLLGLRPTRPDAATTGARTVSSSGHHNAAGPRCKELRRRAGIRIPLPRDPKRGGEPGAAFVPITHPWMGPFCITPVLQGLEQAQFAYLAPVQQTRHIGAPSPLGKNRTTPRSWRVDEADLVVQYYRTPGDRSGTAELQHLPPEVRAMDEPIAVDGTRLVWGVPNASNIGGHKHVTYQAMRRWVRAHGCELDQLQIVPEQFLLSEPAECEAFFRKYADSGSSDVGGGDTWFLKDGTKHGSRGISIHRNSSSVRAAFGDCPVPPAAPQSPDGGGTAGSDSSPGTATPTTRAGQSKGKLSWEERKQFWSGTQKAAAQTEFGDRRGVLVQREVPSILVTLPPEEGVSADETEKHGRGRHKIAIGAYMVVVRVDPLLVVWAANASYAKVTPGKYNPGNTDLRSQVSDSFRSTGIDSDGNVNNMAGAKAEGAQGWQPLSWLAAELDKPELVEEILAPQIMLLFQTLVGAASLGRDLGAFQIIRIDVALRPDLNIVEFEGNMAPGWIAEAPPGDDRCAQEPGSPWLHARNQQLVADSARLVVMAHGGIRPRESVDPQQLYDQLLEGRMFRVTPSHLYMAGEGKEPGLDLDSPFDARSPDGEGERRGGVPRETFLVAYNELQRSCSEQQQQQQQRVFPDPCAEYSKPWKLLNSKTSLATSAAGFDSQSGLSGTAREEEEEEEEEARQSLHVQLTSPRRRGAAVVAAMLVFLVVCRSQPGAAMRLRRKLRRCICPSASKQALQPSKRGDFVL
jgi:hypothetical protein